MSEQHLVQTVKTFDTSGIDLTLNAVVRRIGISLVVLMVLAAVWYGATELFVLAFRDAWSLHPRFS